MSIRIVIADDHRILRAGVKTLLEDDPNLEVIGEATNCDEAMQVAQNLKPDILLLDIGMPGADALEVTRCLVQTLPSTRVLILTMHEDTTLLQEYLRAGASGYIMKRAAESDLMNAIYAVWRGIIYIHPYMMESLVSPKTKEKPAASYGTDNLTSREIEVLGLIANGYTNRQIANSMSISVRTVETHRSNLMDKLGLHSRVELVRYAIEHKLVAPNTSR